MRWLAVLAGILVFASGAAARTIHVPGDYLKIQDAIDAAVDGDEVVVAPGTYPEPLDFLGKAIRVTSSDGPKVTVIDGGGTGRVVTFRSGEGRDSVLSGFTVTGGSHADRGAGIYIEDSSPTVARNVIRDNHLSDGSDPRGAGLYCLRSQALLCNNEIAGNTLWSAWGASGAGICCEESPLEIVGNRICDNLVRGSGDGAGIAFLSGSDALLEGNALRRNRIRAEETTQGRGGGVFSRNSSPIIRHNLFSANRAEGSQSSGLGGAIAGQGGVLEIVGNEIIGNSCRGDIGASLGGGIYCYESDAFIDGNTILDNRASGTSGPAGAGIYCGGGTARIYRNRIQDNRAPSWLWESSTGGGICCRGDLVADIAGNVITGNTLTRSDESDFLPDGRGGGLFVGKEAQVTLAYNTIAGNVARGGGGVCLESDGRRLQQRFLRDPIQMTHSIVWGNIGGHNDQIQDRKGRLEVAHCNVEGGYDGTGNLDVDPQFAGGGGYALAPISPCVDAGDPAELPTGRDLAGNPRLLDGDLDRVMVADLGAHEFCHVHLEVTGDATPGGTLTFTTTGNPALFAWLFAGTAPGETLFPPFGPVFLDLSAPWLLRPLGPIPVTRVVTIPTGFPTGVDLVLQDLAYDLSTKAGNFSNSVELTIE